MHPRVAENIAPVGGPGSDVISKVKWSVTPQKAGTDYRISIPQSLSLSCPIPGPPTGAIFSATPGWIVGDEWICCDVLHQPSCVMMLCSVLDCQG